MNGNSWAFAALVYLIGTIISFFVVFVIKGIVASLKIFKGKEANR